MRKIVTTVFLVLTLLATGAATAQTTAQTRAASLGRGMNLSFLENWWDGTKSKNYSDFISAEKARAHLRSIDEIADAGYKSVRFPVNFGAWAAVSAPYDWTKPEMLAVVDEFVAAAKARKMKIVIDLHHVEYDNKTPGVASTERLAAIWRRVAERYKSTNPDDVLFELRNEPREMSAEEWRAQAEVLIKTIRAIAPRHTLVVGFHDWNSRAALLASKPFADPNIVYTFHFYDPFLFTHQGAGWPGGGLENVRGVPFPARADAKIDILKRVDGLWAGNLLKNYAADARAERIFDDLKMAKDWADKYNVPVYCGEFGSFTKYAAAADRCRHAAAVYDALEKLSIPNAWWEWEGGFNIKAPGTAKVAECFRR